MLRRSLWLFALLLAVPLACGEDEPTPVPAPAATGGAGGEAGVAGAAAGGAGGQGGAEPAEPGRGDPSDFPAQCLETCAEACAELDACGGESSELYPLDAKGCATRCGLAEHGPVWDDLSGNFKCCASQSDCSDVQHCGGWLAHGGAVKSCKKVCDCFFSTAGRATAAPAGRAMAPALQALVAGRQAPPGYRFAPDLLLVEPAGGALDARAVPGARVLAAGRLTLVAISPQAGPDTALGLRAQGRVLPTFLDGAGRVSAATGKIVLRAATADALTGATALARRRGFGPPRHLRFSPSGPAGGALYLLDGADGWRALDLLRELSPLPALEAELDMVRHYERRYDPNDPLFPEQWHLRNTGQKGAVAGVDGRVSEAWDVTRGDPAVIIAINDDGVDLDHPDFAGKLEPALNFPDDWKEQLKQGLFGAHGTACTGVAAAKGDDAIGGVGTCPDCRLLPHLLGAATAFGFQVSDVEVADGFEQMVDAGAWVISNSWGMGTGNPVYEDATLPIPALPAAIEAAFDYAEQQGRAGKGTLVIYAAGNSNDKLDPYSKHPSIVSVGAVGDQGLKSYYSSYGAELFIAAPSNGGLNGITTSAAGGGHMSAFGGTSSACPYVAGVAGLVLAANPELSAAQVRDILAQSATKIDPVFGQWNKEGRSPVYGHGLVNAYTAVRLALGDCADPALCPPPSDACGQSCGTKSACGPCRTQADCAAGHACQALPSLGQAVCVAAKGDAPCPDGTTEANGYCLPAPATCDLCAKDDPCNGRDDDCDGEIDEGDACGGPALCFADGPGCGAGKACAGNKCTAACESDQGCTAPQVCMPLKHPYGGPAGVKGCVSSEQSMCQVGCEVIVSSTEDEVLADFVDCMKDGKASCGAAMDCVQKLPINM
ncbi:MAG: S8 family serine peptidase [Deltaproteobacteria bacterium]|nr:S8 family serine peptidase [Deltaproteobacteria bacterium]